MKSISLIPTKTNTRYEGARWDDDSDDDTVVMSNVSNSEELIGHTRDDDAVSAIPHVVWTSAQAWEKLYRQTTLWRPVSAA